MNKKAKAFRTYLKKAGIFVLDDTLYGSIRVLIAPKVLKDGNEMAVYQLINEYNRTYKSFKYCIDEEGALLLDMCYISNDDVDGDILSVLFDVIIQHLEESYRPLMKAIWN